MQKSINGKAFVPEKQATAKKKKHCSLYFEQTKREEMN
jgi:hypothetical protein